MPLMPLSVKLRTNWDMLACWPSLKPAGSEPVGMVGGHGPYVFLQAWNLAGGPSTRSIREGAKLKTTLPKLATRIWKAKKNNMSLIHWQCTMHLQEIIPNIAKLLVGPPWWGIKSHSNKNIGLNNPYASGLHLTYPYCPHLVGNIRMLRACLGYPFLGQWVNICIA